MKNKIKIIKEDTLCRQKYHLKKVTYEIENRKGELKELSREVFDKGDGATILLFNKEKKTVLLTRQFRLPTFLNGNTSGMLIEACAGVLDEDDPLVCAIRESQEEMGYEPKNVKKIFELYISPGAVTEILHFFIGEYDEHLRTGEGGGLEEENEEIEILELTYEEAFKMVDRGEIKDGKTVILLQYLKNNL